MEYLVPLDRFDGAVLDLDGVVTDTATVHAVAWKATFDGFLAGRPRMAPFDPVHDYLHHVDGRPREDGVVSFLASRGIVLPEGTPSDRPGSPTVCGLARRKDDVFRKELRDRSVNAFPASISFIRRMRAGGRPVAVVSASRNCRDVLSAAGLSTAFDVVIDGQAAAAGRLPGKPDPATFLLAARLLGISPARAMLVEDSLAGVMAGRTGGFGLVVGVDRRPGSEDLRAGGADVVVRDVGELRMIGHPGGVGLEPAWSVVTGSTRDGRVEDALLALSDGTVGVRGDLTAVGGDRVWLTVVPGAFGVGADGLIRLLPGPSLSRLDQPSRSEDGVEVEVRPTVRVLDLRTGVVRAFPESAATGRTSTTFVALARPGLIAVRAESPTATRWVRDPLAAPRLDGSSELAAQHAYRHGDEGHTAWAETASDRARIVAVAEQHQDERSEGSWVERRVVVRRDGDRSSARAALSGASSLTFDELVEEQRRAWGQRWDRADIVIDGDETSQIAVRFALYHLLSCAPSEGEVAVGARGATGLAYSGHVFWDAEAYVLPVLAATHPAGARALMEYRVRRLDAARQAAQDLGRTGVRFPWESADAGTDVTPSSAVDTRGDVVAIRTGELEEHIDAVVAWAAMRYVSWTGDERFLEGRGRNLVVETARYWASRIETDVDGQGHLRRVIGPDEYHESVDDDAFTNGMASWNLRAAAALVEAESPAEAGRWRELASTLVDGFDPTSGRHEQFAGFSDLEPLLVTSVAPVPVAADVLLGHERVAGAQVVKQPDVLMLHHMIPEAMPTGSLVADLDHYLPRTAHGSSLSPGICASLLARAGRPDEAMTLFDVAARLDLDDQTGTTGGGLHLAALASVWHATVQGFAGVRPQGDALVVDPHLPARWERLRIRLCFLGSTVRLDLSHEALSLDADRPVAAVVDGVRVTTPARFVKGASRWRIQ